MNARVRDNPQALPRGYQIEEYRFLDVLGIGGFGITYLAEDLKLGSHVAIKEYFPNDFAVRERDGSTVYSRSEGTDDDFEWGRKRFVDEARTLARFHHPNIVRVLRLVQANNTAYIVMEYEEGMSLEECVKSNGSLTETELKRLLLPLVEGLRQVHASNVLHRDIKPSNVYIRSRDKSPVLLDFGAARSALGRRSRSMTAIVTPGYSPPEQYESTSEQMPSTDIYALSALCYWAATRVAPEEAPRRQGMLLRSEGDPQRGMEEVVGRSYSHAFCQAVDWGLNLNMEKRPQSIDEWIRAMDVSGLGEQPSKQEPDSAPANVLAKLVGGHFGLAKTYWVFGILVSALATLGLSVALQVLEYNAAVLVYFVGLHLLVAYQIVVTIGVWKASRRYQGPAVWPSLARIAILLGLVSLPFSVASAWSILMESDWMEPAPTPSLATTGTLTVDVTPAGASVTLQGLSTPYYPGMALDEGRYRIAASLSGYVSKTRSVTVQGETRISLALEPEERPSVVVESPVARDEPPVVQLEAPFTIVADPSDARVRILNIGPVYQTGMRLVPGDYQVEVARQGYQTVREWVSHGAEPTEHHIALGEQSSGFRDCSVCPVMVAVPPQQEPSSFAMGSNREEGRYPDEGPQHQVAVSPFFIGKYEITFDEWDACATRGGCGANPRPSDNGWGRGRRPVINVSWEDAKQYVDWLSQLTGNVYRLPSEAEWEFAARAGTTTARYWGEDHSQCRYANGADQSAKGVYGDWTVSPCDDGAVHTVEVDANTALFLENQWGLKHMLGNVWEWTEDCWHTNYVNAPLDETAWIDACSDDRRVLRGGSWSGQPRMLRSAVRSSSRANARETELGFRVVRSMR